MKLIVLGVFLVLAAVATQAPKIYQLYTIEKLCKRTPDLITLKEGKEGSEFFNREFAKKNLEMKEEAEKSSIRCKVRSISAGYYKP